MAEDAEKSKTGQGKGAPFHGSPGVDSVEIVGIPVQRVEYDALLALMGEWIEQDDAGAPVRQICTVNPEFVVDAQRDANFRRVLLASDLNVADGVGIELAARLLGKPLPGRVTGSDGIYRIAEFAAQRGWGVYFLGAAPGVAERAASILKRQNSALRVAGAYSGSPNAWEWLEIRRRLLQARPDVLLVAFGHPRQDFWIHVHRDELPARVAIGVGGSFDFVAGVATRAPVWMRRWGIEWLHRLVTQPWRWRRMLKLPVFVWLVLRQVVSRNS